MRESARERERESVCCVCERERACGCGCVSEGEREDLAKADEVGGLVLPAVLHLHHSRFQRLLAKARVDSEALGQGRRSLWGYRPRPEEALH